MRPATVTLILSFCMLQLEFSTAGKKGAIYEECKSDNDCKDCLQCKWNPGKGKVCQKDASQEAYACFDDNGFEGLCSTEGICVVEGIGRDPHMHGLLGQAIDWKGVDGAWYAVLSDTADMQLSVRLTTPLPEEFPDRQLMTAVSIKYDGGHSIVIENKHPYTTETEGCNDWISPCLSDNTLRLLVDGKEQPAVPMENLSLPGQATITAVNMPPECQPYGGDLIWAETYANMVSRRRLATSAPTFREWARTWTRVTAAPTWCEKYLEEAGDDGVLKHRGKHTAFRIETPAFTIRMHHGTNHQGGEVLTDGRVLPELEFWQIDLHLECYNFDAKHVTGILGETMRPVLDSQGVPIMSGVEAIRGEVEDYRISGPLTTDFAFYHD